MNGTVPGFLLSSTKDSRWVGMIFQEKLLKIGTGSQPTYGFSIATAWVLWRRRGLGMKKPPDEKLGQAARVPKNFNYQPLQKYNMSNLVTATTNRRSSLHFLHRNNA